VEYLRANPKVGVVGPRLRYADGTPQVSCYRFPTPGRAWLENLGLSRFFVGHPRLEDLAKWDHNTTRDVDFVIGACLLVRRRVFEEIGGFDERFFLYSEETDWQWRIGRAGWRVAFTPAATVTHLAGGSGARDKARIDRHFFESLDYYVRKNHGLAGLILFRLAMTAGCFGRALLWSCMTMRPHLRSRALAKARLHWWLVLRQATQPAPAIPRS
jgi:N-acetylglucosaminyl-diphospho-decaprenol L-rhamnosyltransferase